MNHQNTTTVFELPKEKVAKIYHSKSLNIKIMNKRK